MKITEHRHSIQVRVIDAIALSAREADFLQKMAKHCVATNMRGSAACQKLIKILDAACASVRDDEPVYELFEDPESPRTCVHGLPHHEHCGECEFSRAL